MLGILPPAEEQALFSYRINLEHRVSADHELRKLAGVLNLDFVIPAVADCYGRSGHVSLDPRLIVKMMLLLFYYNISSERELVEQIKVRLDFLWFLGLDLDSDIPNHSVLSKARARWGAEVFEKLFVQSVAQCVEAGLVNGRLLHTDSTIVQANASKASVVSSSPELVQALRQACQDVVAKLEVLPAPAPEGPSRSSSPAPAVSSSLPAAPEPATTSPAPGATSESLPESATCAAPLIQMMPEALIDPAPSEPVADDPKAKSKKLPVNSTRISVTDPEAQLARSKNGVTNLNYKDHRLVDDAHGVITAVDTTHSNVADGTQLPLMVEQHLTTTGLKLAEVTLAGDHHYGTASNYIFCAQEGIRAHLGEVSANVEERGKLSLSHFIYEPEQDQLRCPEGHALVLHQNRPEEQIKVYLVEDPAKCAQCPRRKVCTQSERGRSIKRHVQAELLAAAQEEANSPAGRFSRKRRQHVMEGSFADAANNHGSKRARWRGLWRQRIQSCIIAAVQNLRILMKKAGGGPSRGAVEAGAGSSGQSGAKLWHFGIRKGLGVGSPLFCRWPVLERDRPHGRCIALPGV
jgi:transposase